MKTSSRKWLGAALLVSSPAICILLYLSGVSLLSVKDLSSNSSPDGSFITSFAIRMHWSLVALLSAGIVGLVMLLLPGGEKTIHEQGAASN